MGGKYIFRHVDQVKNEFDSFKAHIVSTTEYMKMFCCSLNKIKYINVDNKMFTLH